MTDTNTIPDTEKLPCAIYHKRGGHYASQSSLFMTESGKVFRPVFVANEVFKNESLGYGRSIYKVKSNGVWFYFWNTPKCKPFKNSDINTECFLKFPNNPTQ